MVKFTMILLTLVLASTSSALAAEEAANLPADVKALVDRHEGCDHWAGEEPYDEARGKEIAAAVRKLKCDRIDKDVAALRRKYTGNPAVKKALDAFNE
jgi:hypothetical protein